MWFEGLRQHIDRTQGDYLELSSSSYLASGDFLSSLDSKLYVLSGDNNFFNI